MKKKKLPTEYGDVIYWISDDFEEDKITLFFLHGLTASHKLFSKQIEYFKLEYKMICFQKMRKKIIG